MNIQRNMTFVLVSMSLIAVASSSVRADAGPSALRDQLDAAKLAYEANPTPEQMVVVEKTVDAYLAYREAHLGEPSPASLQRPSGEALDQGATRAVAGPDGFGYKSIDSLDSSGPVFDFIDISATGQAVIVGDDVSSSSAVPNGIGGPIALPTPFTLYGVTYTQMTMAANGYITTDTTDTGPDLSGDCPLPAIPSTPGGTTGARIYPLHDDLDLENGFGVGYYEYFTVCPRVNEVGCDMGCHVFMWDEVAHFPGGAGADTWDMEAILYDNGDIVFQIGAGNPEHGSGSTTGIQSENPGDGVTPPDFGLTHVCNTVDSVPDNLAVRIFLDTDDDGLTDGDVYSNSDGDSACDSSDDCPNDPNKVNPGACGCGTPDDDSDGDGVPDCFDPCPNDPNKLLPGLCGCGNPDVDSDGDGWLDCFDNCPNDSNPLQEDGNSDGVGDACTAPPAGQPTDTCGCDGGTSGMMVMPMTLLGIGWMRRRKHRRPRTR